MHSRRHSHTHRTMRFVRRTETAGLGARAVSGPGSHATRRGARPSPLSLGLASPAAAPAAAPTRVASRRVFPSLLSLTSPTGLCLIANTLRPRPLMPPNTDLRYTTSLGLPTFAAQPRLAARNDGVGGKPLLLLLLDLPAPNLRASGRIAFGLVGAATHTDQAVRRHADGRSMPRTKDARCGPRQLSTRSGACRRCRRPRRDLP